MERQREIAIEFAGIQVERAFRADLVVEGKVMIEIESAEENHPVHRMPLLTYLRLSGLKLGLLVSFGRPTFKQGISRLVNGDLSS